MADVGGMNEVGNLESSEARQLVAEQAIVPRSAGVVNLVEQRGESVEKVQEQGQNAPLEVWEKADSVRDAPTETKQTSWWTERVPVWWNLAKEIAHTVIQVGDIVVPALMSWLCRGIFYSDLGRGAYIALHGLIQQRSEVLPDVAVTTGPATFLEIQATALGGDRLVAGNLPIPYDPNMAFRSFKFSQALWYDAAAVPPQWTLTEDYVVGPWWCVSQYGSTKIANYVVNAWIWDYLSIAKEGNPPTVFAMALRSTNMNNWSQGMINQVMKTFNYRQTTFTVSNATILLRYLLHVLDCFPLIGDELNGILAGAFPSMTGVVTIPNDSRWFLSPQVADVAGLVVSAWATTIDYFLNVMTKDALPTNAAWDPNEWDRTIAIVPIFTSWFTDSPASTFIAFWTLLHLEHPYALNEWNYVPTNPDGSIMGELTGQMMSIGSTTRVPGPTSVLYVLMDRVQNPGTQVPAAFTVTLATAGVAIEVPINGNAGVNIVPALEYVAGVQDKCMLLSYAHRELMEHLLFSERDWRSAMAIVTDLTHQRGVFPMCEGDDQIGMIWNPENEATNEGYFAQWPYGDAEFNYPNQDQFSAVHANTITPSGTGSGGLDQIREEKAQYRLPKQQGLIEVLMIMKMVIPIVEPDTAVSSADWNPHDAHSPFRVNIIPGGPPNLYKYLKYVARPVITAYQQLYERIYPNMFQLRPDTGNLFTTDVVSINNQIRVMSSHFMEQLWYCDAQVLYTNNPMNYTLLGGYFGNNAQVTTGLFCGSPGNRIPMMWTDVSTSTDYGSDDKTHQWKSKVTGRVRNAGGGLIPGASVVYGALTDMQPGPSNTICFNDRHLIVDSIDWITLGDYPKPQFNAFGICSMMGDLGLYLVYNWVSPMAARAPALTTRFLIGLQYPNQQSVVYSGCTLTPMQISWPMGPEYPDQMGATIAFFFAHTTMGPWLKDKSTLTPCVTLESSAVELAVKSYPQFLLSPLRTMTISDVLGDPFRSPMGEASSTNSSRRMGAKVPDATNSTVNRCLGKEVERSPGKVLSHTKSN